MTRSSARRSGSRTVGTLICRALAVCDGEPRAQRHRAPTVATRLLTDHHTAASGDDSARDAERTELRARLEHALGTLTPVQREVVLLHDLDGWTHEAIGATIGTSAGMSRQHLFHARKRLREVLGPGSKEYLNDR